MIPLPVYLCLSHCSCSLAFQKHDRQELPLQKGVWRRLSQSWLKISREDIPRFSRSQGPALKRLAMARGMGSSKHQDIFVLLKIMLGRQLCGCPQLISNVWSWTLGVILKSRITHFQLSVATLGNDVALTFLKNYSLFVYFLNWIIVADKGLISKICTNSSCSSILRK